MIALFKNSSHFDAAGISNAHPWRSSGTKWEQGRKSFDASRFCRHGLLLHDIRARPCRRDGQHHQIFHWFSFQNIRRCVQFILVGGECLQVTECIAFAPLRRVNVYLANNGILKFFERLPVVMPSASPSYGLR